MLLIPVLGRQSLGLTEQPLFGKTKGRKQRGPVVMEHDYTLSTQEAEAAGFL